MPSRLLRLFLVSSLFLSSGKMTRPDATVTSMPNDMVDEALAPLALCDPGGMEPFHKAHSPYLERHPILRRKPGIRQIVYELLEVQHYLRSVPRAVTTFGSARFPENDPNYELGFDLGRHLFELQAKTGYWTPPRTGAGPAAMESVPRGYRQARDRAGIARSWYNGTQGIRIQLPFEQGTNPEIEIIPPVFERFVTRKLGLHRHSVGVGSFVGGIGTMDETFEAWQRRIQLVLLEPSSGAYRRYYRIALGSLTQAWRNVDFDLSKRIPPFPTVTTDPRKGAELMMQSSGGKPRWQVPGISIKESIDELVKGMVVLMKRDNVATLIGRPNVGSKDWKNAVHLIRALIEQRRTVRIASRGPLVEAVADARLTADQRERYLQGAFFIPPGDDLRGAEKRYFSEDKLAVTHDPSIHQVFVTDRTGDLIAFPGGVGTLNRLFDNLQLIQLDKVDRFGIHLAGASRFWRIFMEPMFQILTQETPVTDAATGRYLVDSETHAVKLLSMISRGDERLFTFADDVDQIFENIQTENQRRLHAKFFGARRAA